MLVALASEDPMHRPRFLATLPGVLLTATLVSAVAQPPLPAFSADAQLRAARALCGEVTRGTASDTLTSTTDTVSGFLSSAGDTLYVELLSTSYWERDVAKHIIVFGGHYVENGLLDTGESASTEVWVGVFEARGGTWVLASKGAPLADVGFNGRNPDVTLVELGRDRHGIAAAFGLWSSGNSMTRLTLYEPQGQTFGELLNVATEANDCGREGPCFSFEGRLLYTVPADVEARDLRLAIRGTYRNRAGKIVKVPAAPLVFRFSGGKYAPLLDTAAHQALWAGIKTPW
jgi:hypothetical protein